MMSTTSSKNKLKRCLSIMGWDIRSCGMLCAIFSILSAVATVAVFTISFSDPHGLYVSPSERIEDFQYYSMTIVAILTQIFTIIYMIKTFSYLHNKRKADLYGNLPIGRRSLFIAKSASSFILALVPTFFFLGIISIISICYGVPLFADTAPIYLQLILGTLATVSAYGLLAVCCGTTANTVVMFITLSISYPLSAMFVRGVFASFYRGAYITVSYDSVIMQALSPLSSYSGTNYIYWLVFSAVCFAVSLFLIRKRKAEKAQSAFAYYLPCHIVKVLVSFLFGMLLGTIFGSLNVFDLPLAGFIFGFIIGSATAFVLMHLVFYKGFSRLLKSCVILGVLIVIVSALMTVVDLDVTGFNEYVPMSDDVKSAGILDIKNTYTESEKNIGELTLDAVGDYTDKDSITEIVFAHSDFVDDYKRTQNQKYSDIWVEMINIEPYSLATPVGISYKLNDGSVVSRVYPISLVDYAFDSLMYDEYSGFESLPINSPGERVSNIVLGEKYQRNYSGYLNASFDNITSIGICDNDYNMNMSIPKEAISKVMTAFRKDFNADPSKLDIINLPRTYYSDAMYSTAVYVDPNESKYALSISYEKVPITDYKNSLIRDTMEGIYQGSTDYAECICIPKSYENTIKALKEANIIDKDGKIVDTDFNSFDFDYEVYGENDLSEYQI